MTCAARGSFYRCSDGKIQKQCAVCLIRHKPETWHGFSKCFELSKQPKVRNKFVRSCLQCDLTLCDLVLSLLRGDCLWFCGFRALEAADGRMHLFINLSAPMSRYKNGKGRERGLQLRFGPKTNAAPIGKCAFGRIARTLMASS